MKIKRQGGMVFWQAGRFGGSLYRKRLTLAQHAHRYIARRRATSGLLAVSAGALILWIG